VYAGNRIEGSNPFLSAIFLVKTPYESMRQAAARASYPYFSTRLRDNFRDRVSQWVCYLTDQKRKAYTPRKVDPDLLRAAFDKTPDVFEGYTDAKRFNGWLEKCFLKKLHISNQF
jgi:hypothetical protein